MSKILIHQLNYTIMINENLRLYLGSDRRYLCSHHGVRDVAWASDSEGPRSQGALKSRNQKIAEFQTLPISVQFSSLELAPSCVHIILKLGDLGPKTGPLVLIRPTCQVKY